MLIHTLQYQVLHHIIFICNTRGWRCRLPATMTIQNFPHATPYSHCLPCLVSTIFCIAYWYMHTSQCITYYVLHCILLQSTQTPCWPSLAVLHTIFCCAYHCLIYIIAARHKRRVVHIFSSAILSSRANLTDGFPKEQIGKGTEGQGFRVVLTDCHSCYWLCILTYCLTELDFSRNNWKRDHASFCPDWLPTSQSEKYGARGKVTFLNFTWNQSNWPRNVWNL